MPSKKKELGKKQEVIDDLFQESARGQIRPPGGSSPFLVLAIAIVAGFVSGFFGLTLFFSSQFSGGQFFGTEGLGLLQPGQQVVVRQQQDVTVTEIDQRRDLAQKLRPQVVALVKPLPSVSSGLAIYENTDLLGHGFILSADGWVVTLAEGLPSSPAGFLGLTDSGTELPVEQVVRDELTGVNFIKFEAENLAAVDIAPLIDDARELGLVAFGFSLPSMQSRVTPLELVNFTELSEVVVGSEQVARELIVNSSQPVDSGPVFELGGRLVGLLHRDGGELLVLPSDYFSGLIEGVLQGSNELRSSLGANWISLSGNYGLRDEIRQGLNKGAYIESVEEGGAAEAAGLKPGDIVLRVNDFELNGGRNLAELVLGAKPEDIFIMAVRRDGEELELIATLKPLE